MATTSPITSQIQILDDISALDRVINGIDIFIERMERLEQVAGSAFGAFNNISDINIPNVPNIPSTTVPEPQEPTPPPEPQTFDWNTPNNIEVFNSSGAERYRQEMNALNSEMQQIVTNQTRIDSLADNMDIIPDNMINDINSVNQRILSLSNSIQLIESQNIDDIGADRVNNQVERLRGQLNTALQSQTALNNAISNMDASQAQREYQRLNTIISNVEREVRDNTNEQHHFNNAIRQGQSSADGLIGKLKTMVGVYAGIRGAGEVINLSDQMSQSTARLEMIVDDGGSVEALKQKIFNMSQSSRSDYMQNMDMIGKLGIQASNAFKTNDELIAFADQLNKQFVISGTSAEGIQSATLQLTQALGSGVLRGEEFNAVFEQSPTIMQAIADYLGKDIGKLREMAAEGDLTADVVKNALFNSAAETNAKFNEMPMTFSQIWTSIKNNAIVAFEPILNKLNEVANSESFQSFVNGIISGLSTIGNVAVFLFDIISGIGGFISDNWSIIEPVIWGIVGALSVWYGNILRLTVATWAQNAAEAVSKGIKMLAVPIYAALTGSTMKQTAAQWGLNSALYACPLVWIIILIVIVIAVIYLVVAAINKWTDSNISATGIICGCFTSVGAAIWNIIAALWNFIIDCFARIWNFIAAFANFFGNVFNDPVGAIARLFFDLVDCILSLIQSVAEAIDWVFGTELGSGVQGWRDDLGSWVDETFGKGEEVMAKVTGDEYKLDRWGYEDAWNTGYNFGESVENSITSKNPEDILNDVLGAANGVSTIGAQASPNIDNIDKVGKVGKVGGTVDVSSEDLKRMRDIYENDIIQEVYASNITPQVNISFGDVKETADVDKIIKTIKGKIKESINISAEGVHAY